MQDYANLRVWQKGHRMALAAYQVSSRFPKEELYGLTSQIRRCAVSIPANIAEGCGRDGDGDFLRFLRIAMGSANELEYYLVLSQDLGFMEAQQYASLANDVAEVKRMLNSFIKTLRADRSRDGVSRPPPKLKSPNSGDKASANTTVQG